MKKYILTFLFIVIPTGLFAIAGFGLQVAQGQMKVEESVLGGADIPGVTLTNGAFENAFAIGAFLYVDIIPVIDLEVDFQAMANTYDINFKNDFGTMDPIPFGWASVNTYFTVRKDVFSLSIPFLAAAKFFDLSILSYCFILGFPFSFENAIIHRTLVHSYNLRDKSFTKLLFKLSLNAISIL